MPGLHSFVQASLSRTHIEKAEEELRTQAYTALVELSFAETHQKAAIIGRLSDACSKLNDLIMSRPSSIG